MRTRIRIKQTNNLTDRLLIEAAKLRERATKTPPGPDQDALFQKAMEFEMTTHLEGWLRCAELRPPS